MWTELGVILKKWLEFQKRERMPIIPQIKAWPWNSWNKLWNKYTNLNWNLTRRTSRANWQERQWTSIFSHTSIKNTAWKVWQFRQRAISSQEFRNILQKITISQFSGRSLEMRWMNSSDLCRLNWNQRLMICWRCKLRVKCRIRVPRRSTTSFLAKWRYCLRIVWGFGEVPL
jgi:hypothetical protein